MSLCFPLALFPLKPHTSHTYRCHCTLTLNGKDTAVAVEHRMQRGNNEPNAKHACVSAVFLVLSCTREMCFRVEEKEKVKACC